MTYYVRIDYSKGDYLMKMTYQVRIVPNGLRRIGLGVGEYEGLEDRNKRECD